VLSPRARPPGAEHKGDEEEPQHQAPIPDPPERDVLEAPEGEGSDHGPQEVPAPSEHRHEDQLRRSTWAATRALNSGVR